MPSVFGTRLAPVSTSVVLACALTGGCDDAFSPAAPPALGKLGSVSRVAPIVGNSAPPATVCRADMVRVEGEYCPEVEQRCIAWIDPPGPFRRCGTYARPAQCLKPRQSLRFCIERGEHVRAGETLPVNGKSFVEAGRICAAAGTRLCTESEWNFACEGEELRPYPYGWERDPSACNADHLLLAAGAHSLRDLRSGAGAYPRCASAFGVLDMAGNLEELVARDDRPSRPALKGAHWLPGRNHCRARQTIHGSGYAGIEIGFRCCGDLSG